MEAIIQQYYENNAKKLNSLVDKILQKLNFFEVDKDDFYSLANEIFLDVLNQYDEKQDFDGFLYSCLSNKFKTEMTRRTRDKRCTKVTIKEKDINGNEVIKKVILPDVRLDAPISEENEDTIGDLIASKYDTESEVVEKRDEIQSDNIKKYLANLSKTQRQIIKMKMNNMSVENIKRKLNLTDSQYASHMKHITSSKNTDLLNVNIGMKMEEKTMNNNQTFEKSKVEKLSISSIIKKINNKTLRYDHPLQRESDQHSNKMKSNLMSDILQGNPIPALVFAEQVINGISITWNLDGKQRSTNVKEFVEDKFKISKSVRRSLIKYQAIIKDENGNIIPDSNGFPQAEWREFDITNKKFSQLPEELKERFMDYCFDITLYMNCSDEDIAYHIERYNDGKQMVSSQKGIIKLGEDYARMVKGISAMPFFKENGFNYTQSKNGTIDRVCIESVMATEFLDNWKKTPEEIAEFLKKNAKEEHFDNLEDTVERLEKVITDDIGELFDAKDSFIYFSVFAKFKRTGLEDTKFVEFLTEYVQSLHNKLEEIEIDKETGKKRSTKDKTVVVDKINLVEKLMNEFLNIDTTNFNKVNTLDFIRENVNPNLTEEDVEFYSDMLEDLTVEVNNDTKLLEEHNKPSLIALVGYACENDIDLDDWIVNYFNAHNNYILNQKANYLQMIASLQRGASA